MSVANQANEKLTQLVTLTAKIESYLNPAKKGKGKGDAEAKSEKADGNSKDISKEAAAIGGMSNSLAAFFKEYKKSKMGDGEQVKKLLINLSDGIQEAAKKLEEVDSQKLLDTIQGVIKGVAGFTLTMVLVGLAAPLFAMGILVFSLGVSAMNMIFKFLAKDTKATEAALGALNSFGQGAAIFTLTMVLIGLVAPQFAAGVIVFSLAVSAMIWLFSKIGKDSKNTEEAIKTLNLMGWGAAMFSLTMILIGLAAPQFAIGVLVFTLAISGMLLVFSMLNGVKKQVTNSLQLIFDLAKGAAFFALTMILIGLTAPLFALGVVVFTLAVAGMILVFSLLSGMKKQVQESLKLLMSMSLDIAIFAVTMTLLGLVAPLFAIGVIVFSLGLALVMTVLGLAGKFSKEINKGLKVLVDMVKPITILSVVFFLVGLVAEKVAIGALVTAGSILVLGLAAYILGKFDKDIKKGAAALDILGVSLILFSVGLFILALAPGDPLTLALKMAVIAGAIVVLGLAAYVLGQAAVFPYVLLGAAALVALSLPLIIFSAALLILSLAKFEKEQAENLGYTIVVLGGALAAFGLMSIPALIGAAVLSVASLALLPLTASLAIFKSIGWQESDGESLKNALESTVQAFAHALDGVGLMGMMKLLAAIPIVGLLGTALSSLAIGVKAMATMTFTEMEWDEKAGKLVPKRQVRLSDNEIKAVGPNVAAILNALAEPLRKFGEEANKGPGSLFGAGYMAQGIKAAGDIGSVIASLAKGVADMANLNVIEYEVKNGKLKPKSVRKLTEDDFTNAGNFTKKILETLAVPLTEFGENAAKGEGLFSSGYMVKGIEAASKVGNTIAAIAKGVSDMANLTVIESEVKDGKLVPKSVRKLTEDDFTNAGTNVGKILDALLVPLSDFGEAWANGSGWFSNSVLESAVKGINAVTDPIAKLAKMVTELAAGRAVINEVKDGKVVPTGMISFADAIPKAYEAISALLTGDKSLPAALVAFGKYYEENEDPIEYAIDGLGYVIDLVKKVADFGSLYNNRKGDMDGAYTFATEFLPGFLVGRLLSTSGLPYALSSFGSYYEKNEETINASKAGLDTVQTNIHKIANIGAFFNSRVIDIASAGLAAKVLIPVTKDMLEVVRNYNSMQKLIKDAQDGGFFSLFQKNVGLEDVFKDITKGIEELNPGLGQLDSLKIASFSNLTRVIERLARVVSPFERFSRAFGVFSKDMGIFVKNWKKFTNEDAKNFKIYGDVTEKISKVDVGKLKEALAALVKYEKDKLEVEKERAVIVKDIMAGAGEDPAAVMQKLSDFIDSLTGSSETAGGEGVGGKGGPITTPRIQVNGNIVVTGNVGPP